MLVPKAANEARVTQADRLANPLLDVQGLEWRHEAVRARILQSVGQHVYIEFQKLRKKPIYRTNFEYSPTPYLRFAQFVPNETPVFAHRQIRRSGVALSETSVAFCTETGISVLQTRKNQAREFRTVADAESLSFSSRLGVLACIYNNKGLLFIRPASGELLADVLAPFHSELANKIEFLGDDSGRFLLAGNSRRVHLQDLETHHTISIFSFPNNVNDVVCHSEQGVVAGAGDSLDVTLTDLRDPFNQIVLKGHTDFNFAVRFMNWPYLASGSQDISTRVWDLRKPERSLHLLRGSYDAIYALEWHAQKNLLITAEAHSALSVFDMSRPRPERWKETFFGHPGGISLTPSQRSLFVVVCEGLDGVLEYEIA